MEPVTEDLTVPLLGLSIRSKFPLREFVSAALSSMGSFCIGLALGYSSPTASRMQSEILNTEENVSWFGSLVALGAALGCPLGALLIEKIGRKDSMMCGSLTFVGGWLMIVYGTTTPFLLAGRVTSGIAVGITCVAVPVYISEVTSKAYRGRFASFVQLQCVIGILVVYILGVFLQSQWRWLAFICGAIPAVWLAAILSLPESPRKLLAENKPEEALRSLVWFRQDSSVSDIEFSEMQTSTDISPETFHYKDMLLPTFYKPMSLGVTVMVFQQLSGVNAIIFYMATIFQQSHFLDNVNWLPPILVAALQVVVTASSSSLLDRMGRKPLLITSGIGATISTTTFGIYFFLSKQYHVTNISWISIVSIAVFLASFSIGWGAIPWVLMSEIFPLRMRGFACGACSVTNWTCAFLVTWQFANLEFLLQPYGTFWVFGGLCFLATIFVAIFLPETKGKSLEEIEQFFRRSLN